MKVYIEKLFLDNFVVNFVILYFSACFLYRPKKKLRLLAGAAVGGVFSCLLFSVQGVFHSLIFRVAVSALMCGVAFWRPHAWRLYAKSLLYLYMVTFILEGLIFAWLMSSGKPYALTGGLVIGQGVTLIVYLLAGGILFLSVIRFAIRKSRLQAGLIKQLEICIDGHVLFVDGFVDTGNMAIDPLSGKGVIVVDVTKVKNLISKELYDAVTIGLNPNIVHQPPERIRLIPYTTVGGSKGMMAGIKPDYICVVEKGKRTEVEAVVAFSKEQIFGKGEAEALINPMVLLDLEE